MAQRVTPGPQRGRRLLPRLADNGRVLLASYRVLAEAIREERIVPGLDARDGATAANLFLFGRSGHATAMLAADLGGIRALLEGSGLLDLASAPAPSPGAELGAIALSLRTLGPELGDVSETSKGDAVLREALARIEAVEQSLRTEVALALGLPAEPQP